jgi:nucleoside-diphosphate-sugar epimerase
MRVAIIGGHGSIARRLTSRLSSRGVDVVGVIRNSDQAADIVAAGGEPVVCDVEHATAAEITEIVRGVDAVVFAAGAGSGSGAERKLTVDRDGAIKSLEAAAAANVPRYLIISSIGAEDPPAGDEVFDVYLRAKAEADAAVQASDREWMILRPGGLTDDPGTERVRITTEPFHGQVPRDDVAAVLEQLLVDGRPSRVILYLNGGEDPVEEVLGRVAG